MNVKVKYEMSKGNYSLDTHGALYRKIKDHGKEFRALIVPKAIQKYILYESHTSSDHNGITRLYKFLKSQTYWKDLREISAKICQTLSTMSNNIYKHQIMCNFI